MYGMSKMPAEGKDSVKRTTQPRLCEARYKTSGETACAYFGCCFLVSITLDAIGQTHLVSEWRTMCLMQVL